jgi:cytochrome b561
MRPFRLAKQFEAYDQMHDIPARARRTEVIHWLGMLLGFVWLVLSGIMMFQPELCLFGLFLCLISISFGIFVKLWAHIRICTYQIIKEIQFQKDK